MKKVRIGIAVSIENVAIGHNDYYRSFEQTVSPETITTIAFADIDFPKDFKLNPESIFNFIWDNKIENIQCTSIDDIISWSVFE